VADSRIDELRRRLERDPGSRLFAQLAEEYRKAGNHADAIRIARTGLAQHPSYPSARLTLGRALLDSGDPTGARVELETALREAPDNILASRFLGQALEALGELGPALVQLQKTLKMAPADRQLESQIVSLETRLRSPQPPAVAPSRTPVHEAPAAADVTAPMPRPVAPAPAEAENEPLAPTIRIRSGGEPGPWGRRAPGPPPLPGTAAPAATPPAGPPPIPPPASPLAITERLPPSTSAVYESDIAPTLPTTQSPSFGLVDETAVPTLPPGAVATEETVFEPEPPLVPETPPPVLESPRVAEPEAEPEPQPEAQPVLQSPSPPDARPLEEAGTPGGTPFSSSTLAELYLKQGLVDRAVDVYRQLLAEEPDNDRARSRLAEIAGASSPATDRAARRRALERTIAGLETLLAVVQRR
jgi:cytochrome c-type biogenesis protein CcmH/NrfG